MLQQARTDIKKPIEKTEVYPSPPARVKSANPQKKGDSLTTFEVCKQNARWTIILGTLSTEPTIIMEQPY